MGLLSVLAAGGKPSTWLPPGRPRGSRDCTIVLLLPKVIRIGAPSSEFDYRPKQKNGAVFSKNLDFSRTSNHFSDFSGLDLMFAEAHARGFAPL